MDESGNRSGQRAVPEAGPALPPDDVLPRLQPEEIAYVGHEVDGIRHMLARADSLTVIGGSAMVWWGLCLAANWAVGVAASLGLLDEDLVPWQVIFLGAGYVGHFVIGLLGRPGVPRLQSWRTESVATLWLAAGCAFIVVTLGKDLTSHIDANGYCAICAVIFALVQAMMASASRQTWLFLSGAGWLVTAVCCFALPGEAEARMAMCAGMVLFMIVPGIVLMRREGAVAP